MTFEGYFLKVHCAKLNGNFRLPQNASTLLPGQVVKILNGLRNAFMHILDDLEYDPNIEKLMKDSAWKQPTFAMKQRVIELITLLVRHNDNLVGTGIRISLLDTARDQIEIIERDCEQLLKLFPVFPQKRDGATLDTNIQMRRFKSSVIIGKSILQLIYDELHMDLSAGVGMNEIINYFKHSQLDLINKQSVCIGIKYDALLQSLGETLGNLRQYEDLQDIGAFDLVCTKELKIMEEFVPQVKEYRNSRTHCVYCDSDRFGGLLSTIVDYYYEIVQGLDLLFAEIREKYREKQQLDQFDTICDRREATKEPPETIATIACIAQ